MSYETEKLKDWISSIKADETILIIIKLVLMVLVGGLTGYIIKELNSDVSANLRWWHFLIWAIILGFALLIEYRKALRDKNFPITLISNMTAVNDLSNLQALVDRSNTINAYLVEVIVRLNGQTCNLQPANQEAMCTQGIVAGVCNLLEPVLNNMHYVLGSQTVVPVSTGLYLQNCATLKKDYTLAFADTVLTLPPDKLSLLSSLAPDKIIESQISGIQLKIMNVIKVALADNAYQVEVINGYTIVACPVLNSCDNEQVQGVFFTLVKEMQIAKDLESYLKIFNTILANWIYRYDECILHRHYLHFPEEKAAMEAAMGGELTS